MDSLTERIASLSPEKRGLLLQQLQRKQPGSPKVADQPPQAGLRKRNSNALPLSFTQQRLWFFEQWKSSRPLYNIPIGLRLTGKLNLEALEESLNEIVRRHEILRTTFVAVAGTPIQLIAPTLHLPLTLQDLSQFPVPEKAEKVKQLTAREGQLAFDLEQGPLLRTGLLRLAEDEHIFLLTMHHIISDGWSMSIFFQEFCVLYSAYCKGMPSPLPELLLQYADFTLWQREWLQGKSLEHQLQYWKEQLAAPPTLLALPLDHPRPVEQTFEGTWYTFTLAQDLSTALNALSRQAGVTLFMTLLAAFLTLLHRYSGQDDLLVGSPIANRQRAEVEGLIGCFINTLVLRTRLSAHMSFRELLTQVRDVALGAYAHQDLPFEQLVEALQPKRSLSHSPLFQVLFDLHNMTVPTTQLEGLYVEPLAVQWSISRYDLSLVMEETATGLKGIMEYNSNLFEPASIVRMVEHLQILLAGIVADPQQRLADLPLLTSAERYSLLIDCNATTTAYPHEQCLHTLFEAQAARTPEAAAIVSETEQLSYRELNQRANQLAQHLQQRGVNTEVRVGVCMERTPALFVGLLGILKAGGTYVPLDPMYPKERKAFMLSDAQVSIVLTQQHFTADLPSDVQVICLERDWAMIAQQSHEQPLSSGSVGQLAYVMYTSGSTGVPKGVMITHQGLVNYLWWACHYYELAIGNGALVHSSLAFDLTVTSLFAPLLVGQRAILIHDGRGIEALGQELKQAQALSMVKVTPAHLDVLNQQLNSAEESQRVNVLIIGGDALFGESLRVWQAHTPGSRIINEYGPTETVVGCCIYEAPPQDQQAGPVAIGRPIANMQLYVLDRNLHLVPSGVPGELYIGGVGVARGYLNRPELTAATFLPDPFGPEAGARLYKTGDVVRYTSAGLLEYVGRADHQVKIRGYRIELGEIEALLLTHAAIEQAIVVPRENEQGEKYLVAYIVVQHATTLSSIELRAYLKTTLPSYMLPSAFVHLEQMPLTPSGKVDTRALPDPDETRSAAVQSVKPPRDTLELQLVRIWEDILHLHPIGITDNFFDLGGSSLVVVRLMELIRKRFKQALPLSTLFQGGTIEHLASILRQQPDPLPPVPLVAIRAHGSKRPFFCVHAQDGNVLCYYHLSNHLNVEQPFYALQDPDIATPDRYKDGPPRTIEAMAAHYIAAIRVVQPVGPYLLGGWSFGGIVAFEMAQQFLRQGESVDMLAIIDVGTPQAIPALNETAFLAAYTLSVTYGHTTKTFQDIYEDLGRLPSQNQILYMLENMRMAGLVLPEDGAAWLLQQVQIARARMQARQDYQPQSYPGRITLFHAREQGALESHPELQLDWQQWQEFTAEAMETYQVPGDHDSLLSEPHVQVLAHYLQAALDSRSEGQLEEVIPILQAPRSEISRPV